MGVIQVGGNVPTTENVKRAPTYKECVRSIHLHRIFNVLHTRAQLILIFVNFTFLLRFCQYFILFGRLLLLFKFNFHLQKIKVASHCCLCPSRLFRIYGLLEIEENKLALNTV